MHPALLIIAFMAAALAAPAQDSEWAKAASTRMLESCDKGFVAFDREYRATEKEFFSRLSKVPFEELSKREAAEKRAEPDPFLELAREVWPQFLPKEYEGRLVFVECAERLGALHRELRARSGPKKAAKKLENWDACRIENDRGEPSPFVKRLRDCYRKLLKSDK